MEIVDFRGAIKELYGYFRYSQVPSVETIERWYEKVKDIQKPALEWIITEIEDLDSLPRNIPREIKKQWSAYQKTHRNKTVRVEEQCDECHGGGVLHFRKEEDIYRSIITRPKTITYVALCAKCANWQNRFGSIVITGGIIKETGLRIPPALRLTRQEIIARGWTLLEQ